MIKLKNAVGYIRINSNALDDGKNNPTSSDSSSKYFYGNYHNVRFGRGILRTGNYKKRK